MSERAKDYTVYIPGKAKGYVDESMTTVKTAVDSLQQALNTVEKNDNKGKIQHAINTLNSACSELSRYKD